MMLSSNAQNSKTQTMELTQNKQAKILDIKPSTTSSENDFDFLQGKWKVHNRKLNSPIVTNGLNLRLNCT